MEASILYSEVNIVCILVLLLLSYKIQNFVFLQGQRQSFLKVVLTAALCFFVDCLWVHVNAGKTNSDFYVNWILNISSFLVAAFLSFFYFEFSETVQRSEFITQKKYRLLSYVPITLLTILILTTYKTGWLFYIDSENVYHRGPAYFIQLLCAYGYVVFTSAKALYFSFHTVDYRKKADFLTMAAFAVPTLFFGALQIFIPHYPLLCMGNTLGILYVYITLQEQLISMDALTKLNNRNQFFQYLSVKLRKRELWKKLYLLMLDIDYFKNINDKYGHLEGDKALKSVAQALRRVGHNKQCFIARYGGDEFCIVLELEEHEQIGDFLKSIQDEIKKIELGYTVNLSIGCALCAGMRETKEQLIERADKELYIVKQNRQAKS